MLDKVLCYLEFEDNSSSPVVSFKETTMGDELSQNVKVRDRPAFSAHFNIVNTSCNDHDTSSAVTKLNVTTKRSAILIKF